MRTPNCHCFFDLRQRIDGLFFTHSDPNWHQLIRHLAETFFILGLPFIIALFVKQLDMVSLYS